MAGESRTTTDHKTIKKWVEDRGGHPATVEGTGDKDEAGVLRIDFPGYSGKGSLKPISWDEFFQKFDEKHLEFLYQDEKKDGEESRFFKLISGGDDKDHGHSHSHGGHDKHDGHDKK